MKKYLANKNGFRECDDWSPNSWVCVESPDSQDFAMLENDFHVPLPFLEYIADNNENPRIERDGPWTLTILRIPVRCEHKEMPFCTYPLGIITNNEIVITVCYHRAEMLADFVDHTCARGIEVNNNADFILRLIYSSAVWYLKYLNRLISKVDNIEQELSRSVSNHDILMLMKLQKSLVIFNTSVRGNEAIIQRLQTLYPDDIDSDLLEDIEIELHQARNMMDIYSDILNSTMEACGSVVSNNVNAIMKRMTAVSVVLMVPTLIASFYGMNVSIGLSVFPWAFWVIVCCSALLTSILWLILRRSRWF